MRLALGACFLIPVPALFKKKAHDMSLRKKNALRTSSSSSSAGNDVSLPSVLFIYHMLCEGRNQTRYWTPVPANTSHLYAHS